VLFIIGIFDVKVFFELFVFGVHKVFNINFYCVLEYLCYDVKVFG